MGIFGALQSAVSGLKAQSHAMENISGNIANSQTIGYKRIDTSFVDLLQEAPPRQQIAGGTSAFSRPTNTLRGDVQNSDTPTHIALTNAGFFVVEPTVGGVSGDYYTRRGDFEQDRQGYLANGAGYRLKGYPIENGTISGSTPTAIKVDNSFLPAKKTTSMEYRLNVPKMPNTTNYAADKTDPANALYPATAPTTPTDFDKVTITGGGMSVYTKTGEAVSVQFRWGKTAHASADGTTKDTWTLFYQSNSKPATGETGWTDIASYSFDAGVLDGMTAGTAGTTVTPANGSVKIPTLTVDGVKITDLVLNHGAKGITQFAENQGTVTTNAVEQDGYAAGEFISVGISNEGEVVASYTNGQTKEVAQIIVAEFANPNALERGDGGAYRATPASGQPIISQNGEGIIGGANESSNTDISEEFTKLIVTQQAYSANTRIVTASDEMLQEALNMIR